MFQVYYVYYSTRALSEPILYYSTLWSVLACRGSRCISATSCAKMCLWMCWSATLCEIVSYFHVPLRCYFQDGSMPPSMQQDTKPSTQDSPRPSHFHTPPTGAA